MNLLVDKDKNIIFTTCFFHLEDWKCKSADQYFQLFTQLCRTQLNLVVYTSNCYYDNVKEISSAYPNVLLIVKIELNDLNIAKLVAKQVAKQGININLPTIRNLEKDKISYFICMNSKFELVKRTLEMSNQAIIPLAKNYGWIDFGIFYVFKQSEITSAKLTRISEYSFPDNFISFPGCVFSQPIFQTVLNKFVIWRFCGGFFIISASLIDKYYTLITKYFDENIKSGKITWEVNIWAGAEQKYNLDFGWYLADHNDSIINIQL